MNTYQGNADTRYQNEVRGVIRSRIIKHACLFLLGVPIVLGVVWFGINLWMVLEPVAIMNGSQCMHWIPSDIWGNALPPVDCGPESAEVQPVQYEVWYGKPFR